VLSQSKFPDIFTYHVLVWITKQFQCTQIIPFSMETKPKCSTPDTKLVPKSNGNIRAQSYLLIYYDRANAC